MQTPSTNKIQQPTSPAHQDEEINPGEPPFCEIFPADFIEISKRRRRKCSSTRPSADAGLVGLALSGGGIRSASFNLGILQSLAMMRNQGRSFLSVFDYLSTVSGGGYIGSWLSAWIHRERMKRSEKFRGGDDAPVFDQNRPISPDAAHRDDKDTEFHVVEQGLDSRPSTHVHMQSGSNGRPLEPITHLRHYSNYLTPQLGLFSRDTWTAIAVYCRNLFLNQLVILPLLTAMLLLPRLLLLGQYQLSAWLAGPNLQSVTGSIVSAVFGLIVLAIGSALWCLSSALNRLRTREVSQAKCCPYTLLQLHARICGPLTLAAVLISILLSFGFTSVGRSSFLLYWPSAPLPWPPPSWLLTHKSDFFNLLGGFGWGILGGLVHGGAVAFFAGYNAARGGQANATISYVPLRIVFAFLAGFLAGFTLYSVVYIGVWHLAWSEEPWHLLIWAPPLALVVFLLAVSVQIAWHSRVHTDMTREWLGSMGGTLLLYAVAWGGLFSLSIYGPLGWDLLAEWETTQNALISGWVLSTVGGILLGDSPKTGSTHGQIWMQRASKLLPGIALIGLLVAIATVSAKLIDSGPHPVSETSPTSLEKLDRATADIRLAAPVQADIHVEGTIESPTVSALIADYGDRLKRTSPWTLSMFIVACLAIGGIAALSVDINEFSMHAFYRNRLVRCYLRASRADRARSDPIMNFDPDDELFFCELAGDDGPYLIINTALNLTDSKDLGWQERKASSFVLTPRYCGSRETGYCPTDTFANKMTLGTAMAISGAAVSPNWGYHSSRSVAFFLSLFNARLGWWVGNPKHRTTRDTSGPTLSLYYLLCELFGKTSAESRYVYLSDGGHFDNLGIYELVRRRCRYIVCCDAGADRNFQFEDLGNAIRKIRADFGIDIEIDLEMLRSKNGGSSARHHAIGTIRYDHVDQNSPVGMLVYIKASRTGDEPADVAEYAGRHQDFPHETTADQFFSESQFESYRRLGEHIGWEIFRYAPTKTISQPDDFFYALRSSWDPIPPAIQNSFLQQTSELMKLEATLSTDHGLMEYDQEIYPELAYIFGHHHNGDDDNARPGQEDQRNDREPEVGQCEGSGRNGTAVTKLSNSRTNGRNPARPGAEQRAALHFCNLQIQLMENVFYNLRLAQYYAHSTARGWMNLFQRWASTHTFRLLWPSLRSTYSKDFVDFAEYQLNLSPTVVPTVYSRKDGTWPHDFDLMFEELDEHLRLGGNDSTVPDKLPKILRELLWEWPVQEYKYDLYYKPFMNPIVFVGVGGTGSPSNHFQLGDQTWGFGVLAEDSDSPSTLRLMVWIRPAFRRLGLGSQVLQKLCDSHPADNKQIVVLLPWLKCDSPGYSYEMAGWLRFYGRKGFVRKCLNEARLCLNPSNPSLDEDSFCLVLNEKHNVPSDASKPSVSHSSP
jgi:GNAT superfamily N-acetyltransferase